MTFHSAEGPGSSPDEPISPQTLKAFLHAFQQISKLAEHAQVAGGVETLHDRLARHLGGSPSVMAQLQRMVPFYRYADFDAALEHIAGDDAELVGIGGGELKLYSGLTDLCAADSKIPLGQVSWTQIPVGYSTTRSVVTLGVRLFHADGVPVAVMQRFSSDWEVSPSSCTIEILSPSTETSDALMQRIMETSITHSTLRGNVLSLSFGGSGSVTQDFTFLPRPEIPASDVILPPGRLDEISAHVQGVNAYSHQLRAHDQHLKRGLLLYGPPGTGKTHTVKHLIAANPDMTVIVLHNEAIHHVHQVMGIAQQVQPCMVVLEDCDLVAMDRDFEGTNTVLFQLLDALDGLHEDANIVTILTTNRVEVLETALVQRPGRIDLAVEIPRPDEASRRALLELYRKGVEFSPEVLSQVAAETEHCTASFFKELIRRAVLYAAQEHEEPTDKHLLQALELLNREQNTLTRYLISGGGPASPHAEELAFTDAADDEFETE